jgi:3-hydroxybutyryl-CoA dehydrogenase
MSVVSNVGVVGAGTMGRGIAHVAAAAGKQVVLVDVSVPALESAVGDIAANMDRMIRRGTMTATGKAGAIGRISTSADFAGLADSDFVIEAVTENVDVKSRTFAELDGIVRPTGILASNTSSIPIRSIANATTRADRVVGMHFMNPVPLMELVEVIRSEETSAETVGVALDLAVEMGKTPVEVRDRPGFVSNRILIPMINEAAFCLMEGVGTAEAIDTVMRLGMRHPMGPLALADLIGLDVCLQIMRVLEEGLSGELGGRKYAPCPLLVELVRKGHLGRKSGQGFFRY